jgi:hypothetical protein
MNPITSAALRGAGALGLLGAASALGAVGCGAATAIRPKTAPAAAMVVPDFTLPSTLGGELAFADVMQRSATVLVFYRGFW